MQIESWKRTRISHVLDTRIEWSDKELVAHHALDITYCWIGAEDVGLPQADEWFDTGLEFATMALSDPEAVVLVHCHMGINRGPSMAYRILLEDGVDPIEALEVIHEARPIADVGYAPDALDHYHRSHEIPQQAQMHDRDRLEAWLCSFPTTGLHIVRGPT